MTGEKIVLLENKDEIGIKSTLVQKGYAVEAGLSSFESVERAVKDGAEALIISSDYFDDKTFDILKQSQKKYNMPIIMVCDEEKNSEKVYSYMYNVDDYITRPVNESELINRLSIAIYKARQYADEGIYKAAMLCVDTTKRHVTYNGEDIDLTKTEYDLLVLLVKNKNIVMRRNDIINKIWGSDYIGGTNGLDVYIRYLRNKIDKRYKTAFIKTIRGIGYCINE